MLRLFAIDWQSHFKSSLCPYFNHYLIIGSVPKGMCGEAIGPALSVFFTHLVPQHSRFKECKVGFEVYTHIKGIT